MENILVTKAQIFYLENESDKFNDFGKTMKMVPAIQELIHSAEYDEQINFVYKELSDFLKHKHNGLFSSFKRTGKEIVNGSFYGSGLKQVNKDYLESNELGNLFYRRDEFDKFILEGNNIDFMFLQAKRKGKNAFELNNKQEFGNYIYSIERNNEQMNRAKACDVVCFEWAGCKDELVSKYGTFAKAKKVWLEFMANHDNPYYGIELDNKIEVAKKEESRKSQIHQEKIKSEASRMMKNNVNFQNGRDDFIEEPTFQNQLNYYVSFGNIFKIEKDDDKYVYREVLKNDIEKIDISEVIQPNKDSGIALFYTDNKGKERIKFPKQKTINAKGKSPSFSEYSFSIHAGEMNMYLYNGDLYDINGFDPFELAMEAGTKFKDCAFKVFDVETEKEELQEEAGDQAR